MPKFREGDEVILSRHKTDSKANLDIGALGTVIEVLKDPHPDGNMIKVEWEISVICSEWWVHPDAIDFINLNLENK